VWGGWGEGVVVLGGANERQPGLATTVHGSLPRAHRDPVFVSGDGVLTSDGGLHQTSVQRSVRGET
jgi:hypothetical protein